MRERGGLREEGVGEEGGERGRRKKEGAEEEEGEIASSEEGRQ